MLFERFPLFSLIVPHKIPKKWFSARFFLIYSVCFTHISAPNWNREGVKFWYVEVPFRDSDFSALFHCHRILKKISFTDNFSIFFQVCPSHISYANCSRGLKGYSLMSVAKCSWSQIFKISTKHHWCP